MKYRKSGLLLAFLASVLSFMLAFQNPASAQGFVGPRGVESYHPIPSMPGWIQVELVGNIVTNWCAAQCDNVGDALSALGCAYDWINQVCETFSWMPDINNSTGGVLIDTHCEQMPINYCVDDDLANNPELHFGPFYASWTTAKVTGRCIDTGSRPRYNKGILL